ISWGVFSRHAGAQRPNLSTLVEATDARNEFASQSFASAFVPGYGLPHSTCRTNKRDPSLETVTAAPSEKSSPVSAMYAHPASPGRLSGQSSMVSTRLESSILDFALGRRLLTDLARLFSDVDFWSERDIRVRAFLKSPATKASAKDAATFAYSGSETGVAFFGFAGAGAFARLFSQRRMLLRDEGT